MKGGGRVVYERKEGWTSEEGRMGKERVRGNGEGEEGVEWGNK